MNYSDIINTNLISQVVICQYVRYDLHKTKCKFLPKYDIDLHYVLKVNAPAVYKFYIDNEEEFKSFENLISDKKKQYTFDIKYDYQETWI